MIERGKKSVLINHFFRVKKKGGSMRAFAFVIEGPETC